MLARTAELQANEARFRNLTALAAADCQVLKDNIAARRPFLDCVLHRLRTDGASAQYRISGEPMLDRTCVFIGYRGVGAQVLGERLA